MVKPHTHIAQEMRVNTLHDCTQKIHDGFNLSAQRIVSSKYKTLKRMELFRPNGAYLLHDSLICQNVNGLIQRTAVQQL